MVGAQIVAVNPAASAGAGSPNRRCRICLGGGPFTAYRVREMMFALPDSFEYLLCHECGCLQIADIPQDLSRYYGEGYYSFGERPSRRGLAAALVRARNRYLSGRIDPLGWAIAQYRPFLALASLRQLRLSRLARIVDVGCGGGELLLALQSAGFQNLLGVDPFVAEDLNLGAGLRVRRADLGSVQGPFDLVMFHHSLEHIGDAHGTLKSARAALVPGGHCVIRIPTVSSFAWRHYGVHWCALDAPRHFYLHSRWSIALLAERSGFRVLRIADDSTAFQFWGSEQYRQDIALMRDGCHDIVPAPGTFTRLQLLNFKRRAQQLNRQGDGDQIVVLLQRGP